MIDWSSVPHKMAWRSVARAIRAVSRLGGPGCDIFDTSQLRYELDSVFQELDTPPSRCCWRCGCAMSCVSLITADIDQAFEACSASAVLPAWRHISQSYESRFSSNSVLIRRGRRGLRKPGRSQSFGRGWFSFSTPVQARALFSFRSVSLVMLGSMVWQIWCIPIGGVMSSAAVAVVFGVAELVWLDQWQKHRQLGFCCGGVLFAVAFSGRDMWMMLWLAAACFVVAAFLFLCVPVTRYQSRWCGEQTRLSTRG